MFLALSVRSSYPIPKTKSTRRVSLAVALVIVPAPMSLLGTIITLLSKLRT